VEETGVIFGAWNGRSKGMPQVQLPIFPEGVTSITPDLAFQRREGKVCYFNGHLPVFMHEEADLPTF